MKLVELKDLEVGDEIIISCQSYFKYLRILRKPMMSGKTHWSTGATLYKSVKCSTIRTSTPRQYKDYNGNVNTYYSLKWGWGSDDHNYNQYIDLDDRQIVLVKQNEQ
jgi:hypothetical protein